MRKKFIVLALVVTGLFIYAPVSTAVIYAQEDDANSQYNDEQPQSNVNQTNTTVNNQPSNPNSSNSTDQTVSSSTNDYKVVNQSANRVKSTWPWYVIRASGLIAAILIAILLLSGMGFITGHTFKILEPIAAWATHRAIGIALGVSVLIHISALLIDKFMPFSPAQVFVPFVSGYKSAAIAGFHLGSLYVALGIFAFYLLLLVVLTSLLLINKKPKTWKLIHISTYLVGTLVFFHAIFVGTDIQNIAIRAIWIIVGAIIIVAAIFRAYRARTV